MKQIKKMKKLFTVLLLGLMPPSLLEAGLGLTDAERLALARELSLEASPSDASEEEFIREQSIKEAALRELQEDQKRQQAEEEAKHELRQGAPLPQGVAFLQEIIKKRLDEPRTIWWPNWLVISQQSYLPEAVHGELDAWIVSQSQGDLRRILNNIYQTIQPDIYARQKSLDRSSNKYKSLEALLKAWDEIGKKIRTKLGK